MLKMRSHIVISSLFASAAGLSTPSQTESGYLATVSLAPTATGAAALDLEDKRAECFQACYETYGNYKSCTRRGDDKLAECWCNDSVDWVEREEDCVWTICGVSAYNLYGDVLKRVCQTVTASSSTSSEMTLTSEDTSQKQTSSETSNQAEVTQTSTSKVEATSTSGDEAATSTDQPNNSWKIGPSTLTTAFVAGTFIFVHMVV